MVFPSALGFVALGAAAVAAAILVNYLVRKPPLTFPVKLVLFLGLGVLPAIAAASSTVAGMEATTHREFCGSCHVMIAHYEDAVDPASQSLAARHTRNPFFGDKSCYVCHADYGMYGYAMTKAGGMRHVYEYYLGEYGAWSSRRRSASSTSASRTTTRTAASVTPRRSTTGAASLSTRP